MRIMSAICLMGAVMMVGCGSKTTEVITNETLPVEVDAEATVTEEVVDEGIETEVTEAITVVEETAEAEATTAEESTTEEISQESEQPLTIEDVEEKMERLILANTKAVNFIDGLESGSNKDDERNLYSACMAFMRSGVIDHLVTADGIHINEYSEYNNEFDIIISAVSTYYYNFVNENINDYYSMVEYIKNNKAEDIVNGPLGTTIEFLNQNRNIEENYDNATDGNWIMASAMGLPLYFGKAETITYGDIIVGNENVSRKTNSLIPVEYEVPIYVNGESEPSTSMLLDKDKNMLNIVTCDGFPAENYINAYTKSEQ